MNNLVYLLVAAVVSAVGMLILWLRHRTPTSTMSSIDEFNETMRALSPDSPTRQRRPVRQPPAEEGATTTSSVGHARPARGSNGSH